MKKEEILNLATLFNGDNIEVIRTLPENSIDSIVTDPPYGISFMNKKWDHDVPSVEFWKEIFRVLKPGGHVLSFGGTRTYHRMVVNMEDAGFEIRDQIMWIYGSGFPKSHNIGKALDKFGGNNHLVYEIGIALKQARTKRGLSLKQADKLFCDGTSNYNWFEGRKDGHRIPNQQVFDKIVSEWPELKELRDKVKESNREILGTEKTNKSVMQNIGFENETGIYVRTKGESEWEGWGTGLKPANEPICVARKPLSEKSVAANIIKHKTGGLNISGSKVGFEKVYSHSSGCSHLGKNGIYNNFNPQTGSDLREGRFPSNVIMDEVAGEELGDQRKFFYCPKVSTQERNLGVENSIKAKNFRQQGEAFKNGSAITDFERNEGNIHPTIKPIDLMRYLVRLVTPKGGVIMDPFMGSGSTGVAALLESFQFVGIELDENYFEIALQRVNNHEKFSQFFEEKEIKKEKTKSKSKKKNPSDDPKLGFWAGQGLRMAS